MNIDFIPSSLHVENYLEKPKPAKKHIPNWYKNIKLDNSPVFDENGLPLAVGVKRCMPFLDSLTHGYIQSTWCDIYITKDNDIFYKTIKDENIPEIMSDRGDESSLPNNEFYENKEFVWFVNWIPKLPKGWSLMFVSPLNHFDLPFTTTSGIIDSDVFFHVPNGQLPFYIKKDFQGLIPAGTPMYQMIPIKRESWTSRFFSFDRKQIIKRRESYFINIVNGYKKMFWKRKDFN